jgi:hypothetical protein
MSAEVVGGLRGVRPGSNTSMITMRLPQQGQGWSSVAGAEVSSQAASSWIPPGVGAGAD